MPYNVQKAREAGLSNDAIIDYLVKKRGRGYNVQRAREAGLDDEEIIHYLDTGKGFDHTVGGRAGAVPRAFNTAIANAAGAPVDLVNWGLSKIGVPVSDEPFLGGAFMRKALNAGGEALGGTEGNMTYENRQDLPPAERPFAAGGEFLGNTVASVIPFMAGGRMAQGTAKTAQVAGETIGQIPKPLASTGSVARTDAPKGLLSLIPEGMLPQSVRPTGELVGAGVSANSTGRAVLDPILNAVRSNPGGFLAAETAAGVTGGIGGGIADAMAPDSPTMRAIGEIAGSMSPAALAMRSGGKLFGAVRTAAKARFTEAGRMRAAQDKLIEALRERGENPEELLTILNAPLPKGLDLKLSAGQWTNSPALIAMERKLSTDGSERGAEFGSKLKENADVALGDILKEVARVERYAEFTGNPRDLALAARARAEGFDTISRRRIQLADQRASETRAKLEAGLIDQREASKQLADIARGAESDMRKVQDELWEKVPRDIPTPTDATRKAFNLAQTGTIQRLPSDFRRFERNISKGEPVSAQLLMSVRSDALSEARKARSGMAPDDALARRMDIIADGALADLEKVQGPEAEAARAFSKSFHDHFSRGYTGRVLDAGAHGGGVAPELIGEKAFGAGKSGADVRFGQMQDAANFAGRGDEMFSAQEKFIRSAAAQVIDPATGKVVPNRVARFVYNNEALIDRFPGLKSQLTDAAEAQQLFDEVLKLPSRASQVAKRRAPFGMLLRGEDPVDAVQKALQKPRDLTFLISTARKADNPPSGMVPNGPAQAGLRASIQEALIRNATDGAGNISWGKFRESLIGGDRPMLDRMVEQMAMPKEQADHIRTLLNRADRIVKASASDAYRGDVFDNPDALTDLVIRGIGARASDLVPLGNSLMRHAAGARHATNIFRNLSRTRVSDAMLQILGDKNLTRLMLERATSPQRRAEIGKQINAALIQAGIMAPAEEVKTWMDTQTGATVQGGQ